jgi:hypothetical protein
LSRIKTKTQFEIGELAFFDVKQQNQNFVTTKYETDKLMSDFEKQPHTKQRIKICPTPSDPN